MPTKTTPPQIERLKFKDLTISNLYSGRTEKEITENAKEKQKELAAAGGWNPAMPGHYFERDGEKVLVAGFSRVKASLLNEQSEGYFVKVEGDEIDHLLACETTNSVKPLSKLSRGQRYAELRAGVVADDFAGALADPKKAEDWKRQPMSNQDIAERIGKTPEWVRQCIAIYESPQDIRDMLENDQIATIVAEKAKSLAAKHHNESEQKQIAMCKRAIANAKADDKEKATEKHFDAIKAEFVPVKTLKADDGKGADTETTSKKEQKQGKESSDDGKGDDTKQLPVEDSSEVPTLPIEENKSPVKSKDAKKALITVIAKWCEKTGNVYDDDEMEDLADEIIAANLPI